MAKGWRLYDYDFEGFGRHLRVGRELLGWSVRDLARATGINSGSLSRAEQRGISLPLRDRQLLIDVLMETLVARQVPGVPFNRHTLATSAGLSLEPGGAEDYPRIATAAEVRFDGWPGEEFLTCSPELRYGLLLDQCAYLMGVGAWHDAIPVCQTVRGMVPDREARGVLHLLEALALWELGSYDTASRAVWAALDAFGTGWPSPEFGTVELEVINSTEARIRAYGRSALYLGLIYFRRSRLDIAERCLLVANRVGRMLMDQELQFEALHMTMRCLFERGSRPQSDGLWRAPGNKVILARAHGCLIEIEKLRLQHFNHLSWGHHYRWEDRLLRMDGRIADATRARQRASALFGAHPAIAHIRLDQGRLAIDEDEMLARDYLTAAVELAYEMRHAKAVADSLSTLAYLDAVSALDYYSALDTSVCALLAEPAILAGIDGPPRLDLCGDLIECLAHDRGQTPPQFWRRYLAGLEEALADAALPPFTYLRGLHTTNAENQQRVLETIARHIGFTSK